MDVGRSWPAGYSRPGVRWRAGLCRSGRNRRDSRHAGHDTVTYRRLTPATVRRQKKKACERQARRSAPVVLRQR